jgi:hypothetical protein
MVLFFSDDAEMQHLENKGKNIDKLGKYFPEYDTNILRPQHI